MVHHITAATSVDQVSGAAFTGTGPDALIVDADAYLISESDGDGALLFGSWTVNVSGAVGEFGSVISNGVGIRIVANSVSDVSAVTIGSTGFVFALNFGIYSNEGQCQSKSA